MGMNLMNSAYLADLCLCRPEGEPVPRVFVESGTYRGNTAAVASELFDRVETIELCPEQFEANRARLDRLGVRSHLGDSAAILPKILAAIDEPVLAYLDAHWFWTPEGAPAIPDSAPFPLWAELAAIAGRPHADWVAVDDACLFGLSTWSHPIDRRWGVVTERTILSTLGLGRVAGSRRYGDCFCVRRNSQLPNPVP